ncbi:MAG: hypothetical protein Kow00124_16480 [Anaerolineae bacterium]
MSFNVHYSPIMRSWLLRGMFAIALALLALLVVGQPMLAAPPAARPAADAVLSIPAIDVSAPIGQVNIVNHRWDVSSLGAENVGHLEMTAWLGEGSNIVLAGHSEMAVNAHDAVFARLGDLKQGDLITITEGGVEWHYVVQDVRLVSYRNVRITFPTRSEQLTLFTCAPGTYDPALRNYRQRLVVVARPA